MDRWRTRNLASRACGGFPVHGSQSRRSDGPVADAVDWRACAGGSEALGQRACAPSEWPEIARVFLPRRRLVKEPLSKTCWYLTPEVSRGAARAELWSAYAGRPPRRLQRIVRRPHLRLRAGETCHVVTE